MITAVVSTALSIVREKERGTMEQVRMAPIGTLSFVVGKTMPYFVISLVVGGADHPRRRWCCSACRCAAPGWRCCSRVSLFLVGALGTGLLISTVADSQQVAFQMALLISFLPTLMLSGFIFPISSMPAFLQAVTYVVPARYFLVALRGIVLKGVGRWRIWPQLAAPWRSMRWRCSALASLRLARERA